MKPINWLLIKAVLLAMFSASYGWLVHTGDIQNISWVIPLAGSLSVIDILIWFYCGTHISVEFDNLMIHTVLALSVGAGALIVTGPVILVITMIAFAGYLAIGVLQWLVRLIRGPVTVA